MAWSAFTAGLFTSGQILTAAQMNTFVRDNLLAGGPAFCKVSRVAALSLADGAFVAVNFDTENIDTNVMFTATSNKITIKTAGYYQVNGHFSYNANATGQRYLAAVLNATFTGSGDTAVISGGTRIVAQTAATTVITQSVQSLSTIYQFAVNDTLTLGAFQNSGGSLGLNGTEGASLSVAWLGAP